VVEPNTGAFRKETSWPPVPPHVALRHSRRYLVELLNTHLPDYPATAPATPAEPAAPNGAEVLGLVRHLTANSLLAESNLTGRAPTSMAELSPLSLAELLAEWERSGAVVEEALRDARGLTGSLLVTDLFAHELDIRRTLGVDEPRCHPALDTALDVAAGTAPRRWPCWGCRPCGWRPSGRRGRSARPSRRRPSGDRRWTSIPA